MIEDTLQYIVASSIESLLRYFLSVFVGLTQWFVQSSYFQIASSFILWHCKLCWNEGSYTIHAEAY